MHRAIRATWELTVKQNPKSSRERAVLSSGSDTAPVGASPRLPKTRAYAWYVAGLLALANITSIMDRYLLSVVLEEVKRDLRLSDTQLGVLQGPGFIALFVVASVPLGRVADIFSRRFTIVAALLFWSLATAGCAFAHTFYQLLLARLAVGLGEAALLPCAMSLITAYFSMAKLNRGMAVYTTGGSLGRVAGFAGGGAALSYFAARHGLGPSLFSTTFAPWQSVFLLAAATGAMVATFIAILVREPPRSTIGRSKVTLTVGFRHFWLHRRAYFAVFVPFGMLNAIAQLLTAWTVSFFIREHGRTAASAGALIGTLGLLFGPVGHLTGGWLNDVLAARGVRGVQPLVLRFVLLMLPLFIALFVVAPSVPLAATFFGAAYFSICVATPTGYAGAQAPTPDTFRGVVSAIFLIFFTVLGTGVGPLVVGLMGDYVFHRESMLGASIVTTTLLLAMVGIPFTVFGRESFACAVEHNANGTAETHIS
jgi:MFS family permease